jgi:hypothetical protein
VTPLRAQKPGRSCIVAETGTVLHCCRNRDGPALLRGHVLPALRRRLVRAAAQRAVAHVASRVVARFGCSRLPSGLPGAFASACSRAARRSCSAAVLACVTASSCMAYERHLLTGVFEDDSKRPAGPREGIATYASDSRHGAAEGHGGRRVSRRRGDGRLWFAPRRRGPWRTSRLASSRGSGARNSPRACRAHSRRRARELRGARARRRCWPASPRPRAWPTSVTCSQASSTTTRRVRQVRRDGIATYASDSRHGAAEGHGGRRVSRRRGDGRLWFAPRRRGPWRTSRLASSRGSGARASPRACRAFASACSRTARRSCSAAVLACVTASSCMAYERHLLTGVFDDDTTRPAGPRRRHRDVWIWFAPRHCRGPWRTSRLASSQRRTSLVRAATLQRAVAHVASRVVARFGCSRLPSGLPGIRVGVLENCEALVLGGGAGLRHRVFVHGLRASLAHRRPRRRHDASGRSAGGHRDVRL